MSRIRWANIDSQEKRDFTNTELSCPIGPCSGLARPRITLSLSPPALPISYALLQTCFPQCYRTLHNRDVERNKCLSPLFPLLPFESNGRYLVLLKQKTRQLSAAWLCYLKLQLSRKRVVDLQRPEKAASQGQKYFLF